MNAASRPGTSASTDSRISAGAYSCTSEASAGHCGCEWLRPTSTTRPSRLRLGHYAFHVDLDGAVGDAPVDGAVDGLRAHCEEVRVLGSYPAA